MNNLLPSALVLGAVAVAAAYLVLGRHIVHGKEALIVRVSQLYPFAVMLQALHFMEELMAGFAVRFPALFGLDPIPQSAFLGFNVAWIGIWTITIPGIRSRNRFAFFACWFLALAGIVNLVAHPLLALFVWGYFPGLFTAPLVGLICVLLFLRLEVATRPA